MSSWNSLRANSSRRRGDFTRLPRVTPALMSQNHAYFEACHGRVCSGVVGCGGQVRGEEEHPEPESFFARMERSMLAADAEKVLHWTGRECCRLLDLDSTPCLQVVAKGEMTEEAGSVALPTCRVLLLVIDLHGCWFLQHRCHD